MAENNNLEAQVQSLPRFIFKFQDEVTGFTKAVGADDIDAFMGTDLRKFIKYCKMQVLEGEGSILQAKAKNEEV